MQAAGDLQVEGQGFRAAYVAPPQFSKQITSVRAQVMARRFAGAPETIIRAFYRLIHTNLEFVGLWPKVLRMLKDENDP